MGIGNCTQNPTPLIISNSFHFSSTSHDGSGSWTRRDAVNLKRKWLRGSFSRRGGRSSEKGVWDRELEVINIF